MAALNDRIWNAYRETVETVSREALAGVDFVAAVFDRRLARPDTVPAPRRRSSSRRRAPTRQAAR